MDSQEREAYLISLRRSKLEQLLSAGASQVAAAQALNVSESTISLDVAYLRAKAREYVSRYEEHFAEEYTRALNFLAQIQLFAWQKAQHCKYERNISSLLNVSREACANRTALLCDVSLLDRTVQYIESMRKKRKTVLGILDSDIQETDTAIEQSVDTEQDNEEEHEEITVSE